MSHPEQREFVAEIKRTYPDLFSSKKVLEVGSLDINGSIREFFTECAYLGVDLAAGPGVDLVSRGEDLDFPDESFDVVASCECFEHNQIGRAHV